LYKVSEYPLCGHIIMEVSDMYNVGEAVVYSSYGVCTVSSIEKRDFAGESREYYVLRPVGNKSNTFYVPTENEALTSRMRKVYSRSEVEKLIGDMPDEGLIWIDNESQRKEEYRRIISGGDRSELIRLIKTLYLKRRDLSDQHKKLHSADERFLSEAENMLYDEFAYALDISRDEVLPYIKEHLSA